MTLDTRKVTIKGRTIIEHTNKCTCEDCLLLRGELKSFTKDFNKLLRR